MSKQSLPLLILAMSLALVGTIWIQYRWIQNILTEKQKLIDTTLLIAVSNVEEQLNDYRALTFINTDTLWSSRFHQEVVSINNTSKNGVNSDSNTQRTMQIQIIRTEDGSADTVALNNLDEIQHFKSIEFTDSAAIAELIDIEEIRSSIDKMEFELKSFTADLRLDSTKLNQLITAEFQVQELGLPKAWAIYDEENSSYFIHPKNELNQPHDIPLFRTDIISPGRYHLQIELQNSQLIWSQMSWMVVLAVLFIITLIFGFVYSIRLILKQKKISQIKSDFINNMTHEFKTPLASISLAADTLLHPNTIINEDTLKKYVHFIQEEKAKLNNHVERILEVAALTKNALDIPVEPIDAGQSIVNAIYRLKLLQEKTATVIHCQIDKPIYVLANVFHLENALVNILENAMKYTTKKAEIKFEIQAEMKEIFIRISDNGIGMNKKQLTKIFDNFYRVQTGNIHENKGFGLGLSYCKLVIEKMNGTIEISSVLDEGTTVTLKLQRI